MYFHDICGAKLENIHNITECPECLCPLTKENISQIPDGSWVKAISTEESFIDAMTRLYENDPIEYQLKIQQFKMQVQQQKQIEQEQEGEEKPHCPHCKSTNIKSISGLNRGTSIAIWGIFSKKINKSFECLNCKYTW